LVRLDFETLTVRKQSRFGDFGIYFSDSVAQLYHVRVPLQAPQRKYFGEEFEPAKKKPAEAG